MDPYRSCTRAVCSRLVQVAVVLIFWYLGDACAHQYGRDFIVAFPFGIDPNSSSNVADLRILLTNPWNADNSVTVTQKQTSTLRTESVPAENYEEVVFQPGFGFMLQQDDVTEGRAFTLTSSADFGVLVQGTKQYDGYTALPVSQWAQAYRVASHCQGERSKCQIVVLPSQDNTQVTVALPAENNDFRADEPKSYAGEVTLSKTLHKNQSWVISREYDLSGALVKSSDPVGVLSGSQWTTYDGSEGVVLEQMPPLTALGQEFVSLGKGTVRVVATEPQTTMHTTNTNSVVLERAGQWVQQYMVDPAYIRTDRPALVVQFQKLRATSSSPWYPAFTVLTPVVQFLDPTPSKVLYPQYELLAVSQDKHKADVVYSPSISPTNLDVDLSDYSIDMYTLVIGGTPVMVEVGGISREVVGLYLQRVDDDSAYLSPLAALYDDVNPEKDCQLTEKQKAGDTVDNDCDGLVDEDECGSVPATGIDCGFPDDARWDTWGRRFVAVIPSLLITSAGYLQSDVYLSLSTLVETGPVAVSITMPNGSQTDHILQDSSVTLEVPLDTGTDNIMTQDQSSSVYRVTSDDSISVLLYVTGSLAGGSMRLLPEKVLGREYFVVALGAKSPEDVVSSDFQVVSVHPDTSVSIYLKLGSTTANLSFSGVSYTTGDVIRTVVGPYEALHVKCNIIGCDLTGTFVAASRPVALFSISNVQKLDQFDYGDNSDVFLEQLPPVESYGLEFIAMQQPYRSGAPGFCTSAAHCRDLVWIVSSDAHTSLNVYDGSTLTSHDLERAGERLQVQMDGEFVQIRSSKPVLVVQVLKTTAKYDGAMLVVPAISQYTRIDILRLPSDTLSVMKQVVMYTVDALPAEVTVDGVQRQFSLSAEGPLFNMSSLVVNYTAGQTEARVEMVGGGTFGGYLSDIGKTEKICPLAYLLKAVNRTCTVTKSGWEDGVDNDCDDTTDEESCPLGTLSDDDGDGRFNEDCGVMPEALPSSLAASPSTPGPSSSTRLMPVAPTSPLSSRDEWVTSFSWYPGDGWIASSGSVGADSVAITRAFSATDLHLLSSSGDTLSASWSCLGRAAPVSSTLTSVSSTLTSVSSTLTSSTHSVSTALSQSWSCLEAPQQVTSSSFWGRTWSSGIELLTTSVSTSLESSSVVGMGSSKLFSDLESRPGSEVVMSTSTSNLMVESLSCLGDHQSTPLLDSSETSWSGQASGTMQTSLQSPLDSAKDSISDVGSGTQFFNLASTSVSDVGSQVQVLTATTSTSELGTSTQYHSAKTSATKSGTLTRFHSASTGSSDATTRRNVHSGTSSASDASRRTQFHSAITSTSESGMLTRFPSATASSVDLGTSSATVIPAMHYFAPNNLLSSSAAGLLVPPSTQEGSTSSSAVSTSTSESWTLTQFPSATSSTSETGSLSSFHTATISTSDAGTMSSIHSETVSTFDARTMSSIHSETVSTFDAGTMSSIHSETVSTFDAGTVSSIHSETVSTFDVGTLSSFLSETVSTFDAGTSTQLNPATTSTSESGTKTQFYSATTTPFETGITTQFRSATTSTSDSGTLSQSHSSTASSSEDGSSSVTLMSSFDDRSSSAVMQTSTHDGSTLSSVVTTPEDTISPSPVSTSSTTSSSSSSPYSLCSCHCQRTAPTSLPPESLSSVLSSIVSELSVDKTELSATKRKKISAPDDRPSAQAVGYFGLVIIVGTLVAIIVLDSGALYRDIKALVVSCRCAGNRCGCKGSGGV